MSLRGGTPEATPVGGGAVAAAGLVGPGPWPLDPHQAQPPWFQIRKGTPHRGKAGPAAPAPAASEKSTGPPGVGRLRDQTARRAGAPRRWHRRPNRPRRSQLGHSHRPRVLSARAAAIAPGGRLVGVEAAFPPPPPRSHGISPDGPGCGPSEVAPRRSFPDATRAQARLSPGHTRGPRADNAF